MEPFIRSDQYNFIREQTKILINGHASTNDTAVASAIKEMAKEKTLGIFHELTDEQREIIQQVDQVKDEADALFFLSRVKQYIILFPSIDEAQLKQLFPKEKKLKLPLSEMMEVKMRSYLGWNDKGAHRKYLVIYSNHKLTGIRGQFTPSSQDGICSICQEHGSVGLFTHKRKGSFFDQSISRGNYICQDSEACNLRMKSIESLYYFVDLLTH